MTVPSGVGEDQQQQQEESEQGSPWRRGLGPSWNKEYVRMLAQLVNTAEAISLE